MGPGGIRGLRGVRGEPGFKGEPGAQGVPGTRFPGAQHAIGLIARRASGPDAVSAQRRAPWIDWAARIVQHCRRDEKVQGDRGDALQRCVSQSQQNPGPRRQNSHRLFVVHSEHELEQG